MTIVSSGQTDIVSAGIVTDLTVLKGGTVIVRTGGITSGAALSGGTEYVSSGSEAEATSVFKGGSLFVSSGGVASGVLVKSAGTETVYSGASDTKAIVSGTGAIQYVDGGATSGTAIRGSGTQIVSSGGIATSSYIDKGGNQDVLSGGESKGATVIIGGFLNVSSGGVAENTHVKGGRLSVFSGGEAEHTNVTSGALWVYSGGTDFKSIISATATEDITGSAISSIDYGLQTVGSGGVASGSQVYYQQWLSGGQTEGSDVFSGASEVVYSGGLANSTIVSSGGNEVIFLRGAASGTLIEGGSMEVGSGGSATDPTLAVSAGGLLDLVKDSKVSGSITFAINAATLLIESQAMPTAIISGFAPTDVINLAAVKYSTTDTVFVTGNEASLITPTGTYTLDIAGASNDTFEVLKATSGTNLEITNAGAAVPPGFNWQAMTPAADRVEPSPTAFVMSANFGSVPAVTPGAELVSMLVAPGEQG